MSARDGNSKEVEWHIEHDDVIDAGYVAARRDELLGATELRVSPARFDCTGTLRASLTPTLQRVSFSFFEVGARVGQLRPEPREETNQALFLFTGLTQLKDLDLAWSYCVDDSGAGALSQLTHLERLGLECDLTDAGLARLSPLSQLRVFGVECSFKFTGQGFESWPTMPNLRALALGQSEKVGDSALALVERARELDYLNLNSCKNLTNQGLSKLRGGPKLRTIQLCGLPLNLETLKSLRKNNPVATIACSKEFLDDATREEAVALLDPERAK